ncbi:hypothetical protein AU14_06700 [Marinobacter similis]|uniref:Uncharacterized protein n=1 Tax=Marinobacter similis TaxID=1420916 RepID=W5YU94_9GAMM|nr:hypothetical protein AU14_06700 [Marinobacter similis]
MIALGNQAGEGLPGSAGHAGTQHGINQHISFTEQGLPRFRGQGCEFLHLNPISDGLPPGFTGISGQFLCGCHRNALHAHTVTRRIGGHQIAVSAVIASATEHQDRPRFRPLPNQPPKRRMGRALHQFEPVHALLLNHIAVNLPHSIGGKQCVW